MTVGLVSLGRSAESFPVLGFSESKQEKSSAGECSGFLSSK